MKCHLNRVPSLPSICVCQNLHHFIMSLVSFEELLRRADAGDVGAMVAVGLTYLKAGDLEHGLRHMKIAADKGNAVAQMIYGDHVFSGCGVE